MKYLSLLICSLSFVTHAQIPKEVKQEVDQRIQHDLNPSIVLAVYKNGQTDFYSKGLQQQDQATEVTINSVYEIGSITKTFTALLLAQAVTEQKIKLDDAVENSWPQPFSLKDSEGIAITFKQLSTHTSGLPRLPNNLNTLSSDPYADYDQEKLLAAINAVKPDMAGINYTYSNFAVGLLGETLAQIYDKSFNQLLAENIIKPLNLSHTYTQLGQVPETLLIQGYAGNSPATAWSFQALAGAGSIRSSIEDLLDYGVAFLNPPNESFRAAMQLSMQTHYQQGDLKLGLGWHNNDGIWWHNGGTAGFRAIIMIDLKNKTVAAGITNSSQNDVEDLVAHLIDSAKPMRQHDFPVAISPAELVQFTGQYLNTESNKTINIIQLKDQLFFTADKQPKQALTYIGDDTLKFNLIKVKINYQKDSFGKITGFTLTGWGEPQIYTKH